MAYLQLEYINQNVAKRKSGNSSQTGIQDNMDLDQYKPQRLGRKRGCKSTRQQIQELGRRLINEGKSGHWSFLLQRLLNENHNLEHQGAQRYLQNKDPEKLPILTAPRHCPTARIQMLFQEQKNSQKTCFQQSSMHQHRCNQASKRVDHILEQKKIHSTKRSVHQALSIGDF